MQATVPGPKGLKTKKAIRKGKCLALGCSNKTHQARFCPKCQKRIWRMNNPEKDAFNNLKHSATRRGIPFDLSFEDFLQFCHKTQYIQGKGRTVEGLSVDRINDNPERGYHGYRADNIQPLTVGDNSAKYQLEYCWRTKQAKVVKHIPGPKAPAEDDYF